MSKTKSIFFILGSFVSNGFRRGSPVGSAPRFLTAGRQPVTYISRSCAALFPPAIEHEHDHGPDDREDPAVPRIGFEGEGLVGAVVDEPVDGSADEGAD